MVWCVYYNASKFPTFPVIEVDHCRTGALKKDLKTIDWAVLMPNTLDVNQTLNTTTITFGADFEPLLVWVSFPFQFKYRIVTFMSTSGQTKVFNFWDSNKLNEDLPNELKSDHRFIIEAKQEQKINSQYPIMAIVAQYSNNDCSNSCATNINGQGSIVFMNANNNSIKYCYVGNPYNDMACTPENLKTLIDCSHITTTTAIHTTAGTQTNGPINWFKWLKTILYSILW
ncbi:uncharacterized protein LOC128962775 [Oppia nitens]|uniref:uncharacterized protein LOC128962773 n=1 Tax=Oppia nitens TaxID=1686743 RepID=UPI0023DC47D9|nr:uncharacterized protein LOC128962773 [Oppia nitens]XP_054165152.1 uncharacterized protein LOC128962775 [Oppia nitens]